MNPEYGVLGGWVWKLMGKKMVMWYTHKAVNLKLRIAEKFVSTVFTASADSFQLNSKKARVVGHGVDVDKFAGRPPEADQPKYNEKLMAENSVLYVGRISKIKNQMLLVRAADYLVNKKDIWNFKFNFIGEPVYDRDKKYFEEIKRFIKDKKIQEYIEFSGKVSHNNMPREYQNADLLVNLCPTGGMDKAVLEAMSCERGVIAFNKTFEKLLGKYQEELILSNEDPEELGEKINKFLNKSEEEKKSIGKNLREEIIENHSMEKYQNSKQRDKVLTKKTSLDTFRRSARRLFRSTDVVLDIAGGPGVQTDILRKEGLVKEVYAIDIASDMLKERNLLDHCREGDMENLPYEDEFFDKALFIAAVHHSDKTERVLGEAKRVLKKGGMIIFSEPISLKLLLLGEGIRPTPDGVEFYFSPVYLLKHIKKQGLKIKYIRYYGFLSRFAGKISKNEFLTNFIFKLECIIGAIPVLGRLIGLVGNRVFIAAQK